MARIVKPRKSQKNLEASPATPLESLFEDHLRSLEVRNYSVLTVRNRRCYTGYFLRWCRERGLSNPLEITRPVLERYQRHLFHYRRENGEPLHFHSQYACLNAVCLWFRWMTRQNHILHNPASELEMPRLSRSLPKNILSAQEVEQIMQLCEIEQPRGLRERAILEVLYSTGIRRMELIALKLYDLQLDRGLIFVRQGKGKRDRYVPIGERASAWLQKYIQEARPQLAVEPDDMTVFLTVRGEPFDRSHLGTIVKERVDAAKLGKTGACHLFRHTMATLMHENGADIRHIQEILGHTKLETTEIYTHVSIRKLQDVHAATHPAAMLGRGDKPSSNAADHDTDALFSALDREGENEEKE